MKLSLPGLDIESDDCIIVAIENIDFSNAKTNGKIIAKMNWVAVNENLPEKYQRVLVTNGKEICLHYKQSGLIWEDERGYDLYCSCPENHDRCDFREGDITHWMPLPNLPEE